MTQIPANWYDDGSGRLRYWDGFAWTEHFADTYVPQAQSAPPASFGPAQQSAQPAGAWSPQEAAAPHDDGAPASPSAQVYAAPPVQGAPPDLGYAAPGAGVQDASADPFAAAPRQHGYQDPAAAPRKKLPGWGIALIIGGAVLLLGGMVAIVVVGVNAIESSNSLVDTVFDDLEDEAAVPPELAMAYWDLDLAYRHDSCAELKAITTPRYLESLGVDADTCVGAFNLDEYEVGFDGTIDEGSMDVTTGSLSVYETYTEAGIDYGDYAEYTLVQVNGEWLFDSLVYGDY